jgi:hypothetical protein
MYTFVSRWVSNPAVIDFIKMIVRYKSKIGNSALEKEDNSLIHSLTLTTEMVDFFMTYGNVAYQLLSN